MLVRSPFRNSFWIGDLHFLYALKIITVISNLLFFFSLSHTNAQFPLSAHGFFFPLPQPFSRIFFANQTHKVRIYFWFLETQGSTIDSIYGLLFLSRAPQDSTDTTASKLLIYSSIYIKTTKINYSNKGIFHLAP